MLISIFSRRLKSNPEVPHTIPAVNRILLSPGKYWKTQSQVNRVHGQALRHIHQESPQGEIQEAEMGLCSG